ncbi:unnamed protein product [Amoebophrya sp. A120]|nr:unnamed protein product [Amoebophrya sp. A120]|eukprot:GSA120T00003247001.1
MTTSTEEEFARLKALVFRTLENNGVLRDIRTQIRHNVYKTIEQDEVSLLKPTLHEPSLAATLVFDWLERSGYARTANLLQHEANLRQPDEENLSSARKDLDLAPSDNRCILEAVLQEKSSGTRHEITPTIPFNPPVRERENLDAAESRGAGGAATTTKDDLQPKVEAKPTSLEPLPKPASKFLSDLPPIGGRTASGSTSEDNGILNEIDSKIANLRLGKTGASSIGPELGSATSASSSKNPSSDAAAPPGNSSTAINKPAEPTPSASPGVSAATSNAAAKFSTFNTKPAEEDEEEIMSEIEESISAGGLSEEYEEDFVQETKTHESLPQVADFSVDSTELEKYDHMEEIGS